MASRRRRTLASLRRGFEPGRVFGTDGQGIEGRYASPIAPATSGAATLGQHPLGSTLMMHAGLTHGGSHRVRLPESIDRCREWLAAQRSRIYPAFGQNRRPAEGRSTAIGCAHAPARGSPMKTDRGMRRTPAGRRKSVITADPSARTLQDQLWRVGTGSDPVLTARASHSPQKARLMTTRSPAATAEPLDRTIPAPS